MPLLYTTAGEFLELAGGADRLAGIASPDNVETYLASVLAGAEARLQSGIGRAGYVVPVDLEAVPEDLRDGTRAMLGQYVAGLAAQTIGGPDHLLKIGEEALRWLKALLDGSESIPGMEKPAEGVSRRPRVFKVTTGEKNIPAALFAGMSRIGGAR